jgi:ubiquinone/menaquinone biosynthesis C-methylase UbiE
MDVKEAYNTWADQYDSNENKTRDLEAIALRTSLADIDFDACLEIGCGTGKNTEWLITRAKEITAVDFSGEMLAKAKAKINADNVDFILADITKEWLFISRQYDMITFSLVLEHIEHLDDIFKKLSKATKHNGYVYIGELHPFKQYNGTKARFETNEGLRIVTCFNHNISDFTLAATQNGFEIISVQEYFDNNDRTTIPRILTLFFRKNK